MAKIISFLAAPTFEDEEKTRVARILYIISWSIIVLMSAFIIFDIFFQGQASSATVANAILVFIVLGLIGLTRKGYVNAAAVLLVILGWTNLTYQAWTNGGVRDGAFLGFVVIILLANLLLGWKAGLATAAISILTGWFMAYAETNGILAIGIDSAYERAAEATVIFGVATVVLALATAGLSAALQRARKSEQSFAQSNRELQELSHSLEEQVAARTSRLEISAALSERLNAILNLDTLLFEVVNQIKDNFGYYHAHIYLIDDNNEKLVVAAGTGDAGEIMKAQGHNIELNSYASLVSRAARNRQVVRVDDVQNEPDWLQNPLLPDTRSEMAVPIILDGQVAGVLDVQNISVAGFDDSDANVLRSLANQVAIAIRNARLFQEVETSLAQAQTAQERYVEQAWQNMAAASPGSEYHYARPNTPALTSAAVEQANKMAATQSQAAVVNLEDNQSGESSPIVAPVIFRNQNIGALQVYATGTNQTWSDDDLAIVEAVVDQLAQSAENLRLFDETRERAGREVTIREITDKLRAAPNLEQLITIATNEIAGRLSATHAKLELGVKTQHPVSSGSNGQGEGE